MDTATETAPETQALATTEKHSSLFLLRPRNLSEALEYANMIASSDLAPSKDYKDKPGNVLIAMQMGAEVGLAPMQALQNISVINGRPSVWGDAALAIVMNHKAYENHTERIEGDGQGMVAIFRIKRRDHDWYESRFSVTDALKAGLWSKAGTWQQYPKRMLQMRARSFGMRDKFPDALRGLSIAEEAMDMEPVAPDVTRTIDSSDISGSVGAIAPEVISEIKCSLCRKEVKGVSVPKKDGSGYENISAERILLTGKAAFGGANICGQCQIDIKNGKRKAPGDPSIQTVISRLEGDPSGCEIDGVPRKTEISDEKRPRLIVTFDDGKQMYSWHTKNTRAQIEKHCIDKPCRFFCDETKWGYEFRNVVLIDGQDASLAQFGISDEDMQQ